MQNEKPRGLVVVDVGYTNTKAILFSPDLKILAERKIASRHLEGPPYKMIDPEPVIAFLQNALLELDAILPVDCIVPSAHGACIVSLNADGSLAFPVMDYSSEPPADVIADYRKIEPAFSEVYCTLLPMALTHAMQLFWQQRLFPQEFKAVKTILPWMQYIAFRLCGVVATEISSMACQSQLLNVNTGEPSSLAVTQGWGNRYAPQKKAWARLGKLNAEFKNAGFRGKAQVLTGVHDSNANYLRYLAGGLKDFTLLSTGTWIISFNSAADISKLDHTKDTNTNTDVLGRAVACSRFFGGKELEILLEGASAEMANLRDVQKLVTAGTMALPSFTDSGGPFPGTGNKGRIVGPIITTDSERASLAALYCAQMVSAQLDAVQCKNQIIVDGPFAKNAVFLELLAQLRTGQNVYASDLRDGTAVGAACLALMTDAKLPNIKIKLSLITFAEIHGLENYMLNWRRHLYV
jgi:sugar (pentulose or hexulose) kinase